MCLPVLSVPVCTPRYPSMRVKPDVKRALLHIKTGDWVHFAAPVAGRLRAPVHKSMLQAHAIVRLAAQQIFRQRDARATLLAVTGSACRRQDAFFLCGFALAGWPSADETALRIALLSNEERRRLRRHTQPAHAAAGAAGTRRPDCGDPVAPASVECRIDDCLRQTGH